MNKMVFEPQLKKLQERLGGENPTYLGVLKKVEGGQIKTPDDLRGIVQKVGEIEGEEDLVDYVFAVQAPGATGAIPKPEGNLEKYVVEARDRFNKLKGRLAKAYDSYNPADGYDREKATAASNDVLALESDTRHLQKYVDENVNDTDAQASLVTDISNFEEGVGRYKKALGEKTRNKYVFDLWHGIREDIDQWKQHKVYGTVKWGTVAALLLGSFYLDGRGKAPEEQPKEPVKEVAPVELSKPTVMVSYSGKRHEISDMLEVKGKGSVKVKIIGALRDGMPIDAIVDVVGLGSSNDKGKTLTIRKSGQYKINVYESAETGAGLNATVERVSTPPTPKITCYQCKDGEAVPKKFSKRKCPSGWQKTEPDCAPAELQIAPETPVKEVPITPETPVKEVPITPETPKTPVADKEEGEGKAPGFNPL